jgi:GGDEF domain-containing protein
LLARLLCEATDERLDFVGHIGGDDFFVIFAVPTGRCAAGN